MDVSLKRKVAAPVLGIGLGLLFGGVAMAANSGSVDITVNINQKLELEAVGGPTLTVDPGTTVESAADATKLTVKTNYPNWKIEGQVTADTGKFLADPGSKLEVDVAALGFHTGDYQALSTESSTVVDNATNARGVHERYAKYRVTAGWGLDPTSAYTLTVMYTLTSN